METERRTDILGLGVRYFERALQGKSRRYLIRKRGLADETIRHFRLGYAPPAKGLLRFLQQHGAKAEEAVAVGLFYRRGARLQPAFSNRIVFPLIRGGKVLSLVGRELPGDSSADTETPKYLTLKNPPDENRRSVFFGEGTVKHGQPAVVTEGLIDTVLAVQTGFAAFSVRGLHVSKRDLPHLSKLCTKAGAAYLVFDAEFSGAGSKGADALGEKLCRQGVRVKVVQLPLSKHRTKVDLAEFILEKGERAQAELSELLKKARTWLEWRIESIPADAPRTDLPKVLRSVLLHVAGLVGLERDHYRKLIHRRFNVGLRAIQEEMELAVVQRAASPVQASKVRLSPAEREAAMGLLKRPSLLYDFKETVQRLGVAGEGRNIQVLGLAMTSRLLPDPISVLVKGQSSAGKSYLVEHVKELFPDTEVYVWSGMSAKVPVYSELDYRHKVLVVLEREGGEPAQPSLRYLQSEKVLIYEVVIKKPSTGEFETKQYRHEGPIACVTTTTEALIRADDENRNFSISPDESDEQTRRILRTALEQKIVGQESRHRADAELELWRNAQILLAEQNVRVVFPSWFRDVHGSLPARPLRLRRDWPRFLALCEAVTLLHQLQRPRTGLPDGTVELTVTLEDYALARIVGKEALRRTLYQMPPNTQRIIETVQKLSDQGGVTYKEIMEATGMTYPAVYKWARPALQAGYLSYQAGSEKSNVKRLRLEKAPHEMKLLPSPGEILRLHPEVRRCRYVHPLTGRRKRIRARSELQKAIKAGTD